jgi:hypothetical protein
MKSPLLILIVFFASSLLFGQDFTVLNENDSETVVMHQLKSKELEKIDFNNLEYINFKFNF